MSRLINGKLTAVFLQCCRWIVEKETHTYKYITNMWEQNIWKLHHFSQWLPKWFGSEKHHESTNRNTRVYSRFFLVIIKRNQPLLSVGNKRWTSVISLTFCLMHKSILTSPSNDSWLYHLKINIQDVVFGLLLKPEILLFLFGGQTCFLWEEELFLSKAFYNLPLIHPIRRYWCKVPDVLKFCSKLYL